MDAGGLGSFALEGEDSRPLFVLPKALGAGEATMADTQDRVSEGVTGTQ